jgi:O-antigen/teichoic acid export membrane protein
MNRLAMLRQLRNDLRPGGAAGQDQRERAASRNRRAVLTGGTAAVARAVQVGTSLITIPLVLHYLGNERFGLWMTISSVLAMANFADFGVGNGVLNMVASAYGKDDFDDVRRAISSGFAVLGAIAVVLLGLFAVVYGWVSWADLFRASSVQARAEAGPALLVFAVCFALNIALDLVQRAQLGLQQGFRTNAWQICGSLAGLAGVILAIRMNAGLPVLVGALAGAPVLATAMNWVHFFAISRPDLRPRRNFVSRHAISQITRLGGLFFVLQLVVGVAFSADNFIVARTLGAAAVPEYSIPQRMFSLISLLAAMLVAPLWPAYGEAISRRDMAWVRGMLSRSLMAVFGATTVASAALLLLAPWLISWWVGSVIHPPMILLAGLALWTVMDCCGNTLAMFLNGASIVRYQIIVATLFGAGCLTVKVLLTRHYGVIGIPWATISTYALLVVLPSVIYVPRMLKDLPAAPSLVAVPAAAHSVAEE